MAHVALLFLALIGISGCSYHHTTDGHTETPPSGFQNPNGSGDQIITFADVKAVVFDQSCTECHARKSEYPDFTTYASVKEYAPEIVDRVFVEENMPPKTQLTDLQKQILKTWLDNGSPE